MNSAKRKGLRIPIAMKLVGVTTLLMLAATLTITLKSSYFFAETSKAREDYSNLSQAKATSEEVDNALRDMTDKAKVVGGILYKNFASESEREAALDLTFRADHDMVAVELLSLKNEKDDKPTLIRRIVNDDYLKLYELRPDYIETLRMTKPFPVAIPFAGEVELRNSSTQDGAPLLTLGVPLVRDENTGRITYIVLCDIRLDKIQKLFTAADRTLYLVDREGHVLAHPDEKLVRTGKKLDDIPIVHEAISVQGPPKQFSFQDPETDEMIIGAYAKTHFGATAIASVPQQLVLEPSENVRRQALFITGIALSLALFFTVLFSTTLSQPIETLAMTTAEVAKGNFDVRANVKSLGGTDEVSELASAFNHMIDGLKERDKVKSLFNKFHGTGIANKLITGEMKLGGEQREATVFFSDIRSFTAFSEKVQPQEVVDMLNEYFKIMVGIIQKNKGVVDKFIGDAIMAVWGAPESSGNDAANALRACLEMRMALAELNKQRMERGAPALFIGMGVHTGSLIAGTIGSDDRMEYTVIGDTVNMASRIEAATKAYGTDLLVSEVTYERVKDFFTFEEAGSAVVKGKSEPLKLFKVTGYVDQEGKQIPVATEYSAYEAEHADKVKVA